jgi:hypothetical protein
MLAIVGDFLNIIRKIALYFARKEFCRSAIAEHADLSIFKGKPSSTVLAGILLVAFSNLIGLPAVIVVGIVAAWLHNALLAAIGIPLIYGLSWLIFILGMYLAGPKYGKAIGRWMARVILEKILGEKAKNPDYLPEDESGSKK